MSLDTDPEGKVPEGQVSQDQLDISIVDNNAANEQTFNDSVQDAPRPTSSHSAATHVSDGLGHVPPETSTPEQYIAYSYPPDSPVSSQNFRSIPPHIGSTLASHSIKSPHHELFLPGSERTSSALKLDLRNLTAPSRTTLRRSLSSYTAREFSPHLFPVSPIEQVTPTTMSRLLRESDGFAALSPQSGYLVSALSATGTQRWHDRWSRFNQAASIHSSNRPSSRAMTTPVRSSHRHQDSISTVSEATFEDASQFHLFAEALTGIGSFDPNEASEADTPVSPLSHSVFDGGEQQESSGRRIRRSGYGSVRQNTRDALPTPTSYGAARIAYQDGLQSSRMAPPATEATREFYAPVQKKNLDKPLPRIPPTGSLSSVHQGPGRSHTINLPQQPGGQSSPSHPTPGWLALNQRFDEVLASRPAAAAGSAAGPWAEVGEALPNYAQSQRDVLARQRAAAASRARELELRWAQARAERKRRS